MAKANSTVPDVFDVLDELHKINMAQHAYQVLIAGWLRDHITEGCQISPSEAIAFLGGIDALAESIMSRAFEIENALRSVISPDG